MESASVFTQFLESGTGKPVEFELKAAEQIGNGGLHLKYLAKNVRQDS